MDRIRLAYVRIVGQQGQRMSNKTRTNSGFAYGTGTYWSRHLLHGDAREVIDAEFREVPERLVPYDQEKPGMLSRFKAWVRRLWTRVR